MYSWKTEGTTLLLQHINRQYCKALMGAALHLKAHLCILYYESGFKLYGEAHSLSKVMLCALRQSWCGSHP